MVYFYVSNKPKDNAMETAMKLAIETYSNLTGKSQDTIIDECQKGNKLTIEIVQKLMFAA